MSKELRKLANVGPAMVRDFARLGITEPAQLAGRDAVELAEPFVQLDGVRHDPC
ncbi:helix-hairpin-helix domain-containing protein, partial [Allokutzneria sp. NRRL B-24872]|uniref:helix-hairpin-helix domain-containing protein n=1 Tax=Allokutzneria sp. NRRL B-24872 TaxID=1137961 RepID=UPI001AEFDD02